MNGEPPSETIRKEECISNSHVKTCVNDRSSLMGPWPARTPPHLGFCSSECPWATCHFHLGTAWRSVVAASRESSLFRHLQRLLVTNCTVLPQPSLGWRWSSFSTGLLNSAMTFIHSLKQQTLRLTKSIPKRVFLVFPCGLFPRTSGQDYGTGTEEQTQFCPLNL